MYKIFYFDITISKFNRLKRIVIMFSRILLAANFFSGRICEETNANELKRNKSTPPITTLPSTPSIHSLLLFYALLQLGVYHPAG